MTKSNMNKNIIAHDLGIAAKAISAADRKNLTAVADGFVAGVKLTEEINKALRLFVGRHGWDSLKKGLPNPKVKIDADPAVTAERKAKKANPYLRYIWLSIRAVREDKTASNVITIIKKQAQQGLYLGEVKDADAKGKGKGKSEPAIRVQCVGSPDEITAGIGLADWARKNAEAYPQLAAFLLPALRAYLGDAYEADDTGAEE